MDPGISLALEALHVVWLIIKNIRDEKSKAKRLHAFFTDQLELAHKDFKSLVGPHNEDKDYPDLVAAVSE